MDQTTLTSHRPSNDKAIHLYLDIETIPSQDAAAKAAIFAKHEVTPPNLDAIEPAANLKDPEKILADIHKRREKAIADFGVAVKQALADAEEEWRRTATNGGLGHLASIAWSYNDDPNISSDYNNSLGQFRLRGVPGDVPLPKGYRDIDVTIDAELVREGEAVLLRDFFHAIEIAMQEKATAAAESLWIACNPRQEEDGGPWILETSADGKWAQFVESKDGWIARNSSPNTPVIVAHYADFDIRFIWQRAIALGVPVPAWWPIGFNKYRQDQVVDTMTQWSGAGGRISLDNLCRVLSVCGKGDVDGSDVWDLVRSGRMITVVDYNEDDVRRLRSVHRRMCGLCVIDWIHPSQAEQDAVAAKIAEAA